MNIYFLNLLSDACSDISILRTVLFIKTIISYMFILIPMGGIVFLSIDMVKNTLSSDLDEHRKNLIRFIKRAIYLVLVFLVPTIVSSFDSIISEVLGYDTSDYKKCLSVTRESIDYLTEKEKEKCIGDYEWDSVNNICVYQGDYVDSIDGSVIFARQRVNGKVSFARNNPNSKSGTMMEYRQGDSRWAGVGFCYGKYNDGSTVNIANSGCGPSALAMIITGYGNDPNATPKTVRDYLCNEYPIGSAKDGLEHYIPSHGKFLNHFGMSGEVLFSGTGKGSYSQELADKLKGAVDSGYGILLLIPGHYVAVDKGNCPMDKVYYYNPAEMDNGCLTMKELWNKTWNRKNRCSKGVSCGWRMAWKYKPANSLN